MGTDTNSQQVNGAETVRGGARPPFLFLGALLLGFALDHVLPLTFPLPRTDLHRFIAGTLVAVGVAVFAAAIRNFSAAGTPVQGNRATRVLVTTGIHGWSRNPIYLGMFLIYIGIGIGVRSPSILILALPLAVIIRYSVVAREEAYMEERFGEAYRAYKARVRRWL